MKPRQRNHTLAVAALTIRAEPVKAAETACFYVVTPSRRAAYTRGRTHQLHESTKRFADHEPLRSIVLLAYYFRAVAPRNLHLAASKLRRTTDKVAPELELHKRPVEVLCTVLN